jgi:hypothetical protein
VIEINSSFPPDQESFHVKHGASFATMNRLAEDQGYFLIAHTGNCIYVSNKHRELFPDADQTFNTSWL